MKFASSEPNSARGDLPSFDTAIDRLRMTLGASPSDADRDTDIPRLLVDLANAAKAQGMKPETVVVAFRKEWEKAVAGPRLLSEESDLRRLRAIDTLLAAYFAGPAD